MMNHEQWTTRAQQWREADPDPHTRAELTAVLETGRPEDLEPLFGRQLRFGTAGMRGALGPGPNRMNRLTVRRVSAGLGQHLLATVPDATERGVVIGFDGRHGSAEFAEDTAAVLGAMGFLVYLYDKVIPTPLVAHAIGWLGTAAGVVVTASHNPPGDNGYKVFWGDGAQIIPPHDAAISAARDALEDWPAVRPLAQMRAEGRLKTTPAKQVGDYFEEVWALRVHAETADMVSGVRAVYTPLHGVGWKPLKYLIMGANHPLLHVVPEQRDPDGDFPTVRFPNPEEDGALDLALALARQKGVDLVLANDPDADRLAVAVPDPTGEWVILNGNQLGCLLAEDLLTHGAQVPNRMVATTIVSSGLLAHIAKAHDAVCVETLTGFKWIGHAALAHPGPFVIGYEEALGYSIGSVVRDKDGLSAALILLDLAQWCRTRGLTLYDQLVALYRRYGYWASEQKAMVLQGDAGRRRIAEIIDGLRSDPPTEIGGCAVVRIRDVLTGQSLDLRTGKDTPLTLPKSNVLAYDLEDGSRALVRPSGTEPKIKFYLEVRQEFGTEQSFADVEALASQRLGALRDAFLARATGASSVRSSQADRAPS